MVVGFLFSTVVAALLTALTAVVLEVGIGIVALGYIGGGLCGGMVFLQVVLGRGDFGSR